MFYIHPAVQMLATVLALYTFSLGWPRLWAAFVQGRARFAWKRHVFWGKAALALLLAGFVGGAAITGYYWGATGLTGMHYWVGVGMAPVMLFALISGLILNWRKGAFPRLAILHGLNNTALVILTLLQVGTGIMVLRNFVL